MIDMYTNVFSLEVTRTGRISTTLGAYLGTATRQDESGRFIGGQFSLSSHLGPIEVGMAYMGGRINSGFYQKTALETAIEIVDIEKMPLALTFAIEDRKFNFEAFNWSNFKN